MQRRYLEGRRLRPETIRRHRLGRTPGVRIPTKDGARYGRVAGITIPWFEGDRLALVKIRRIGEFKGAKRRMSRHFATARRALPRWP